MSDEERRIIESAYACQRCSRRDGLDAVIPNKHWATITEGYLLSTEVVDGRWNLLCLWCIDELCVQHGIKTGAYLAFCGRNVYGTDNYQLEALRAAGYKLRITVEATAPCAISGASAEGETVEEAVKKLGVKLENLKGGK